MHFYAGSVLGFDAAQARPVDENKAMLTLGGTVAVDAVGIKPTIDLLTVPTAKGSYLLLAGANANTSSLGTTLTVNGSVLTETRAADKFTLDNSSPNKLILKNEGFTNENLTWTGDIDTQWDSTDDRWRVWDVRTKNWEDGGEIQFFHGDKVTFDGGINVYVGLDSQMRVADMTVDGAAYTFSGDGSILATASGTTLTGATGRLLVTGNGSTADFTGLKGANSFEGGVELLDGRLVISRADQLGTSLDRLQFTGNCTLEISAPSETVTFDDANLKINSSVGLQANIEVTEDSTLITPRPLEFIFTGSYPRYGVINKAGSGTWKLGGQSKLDPQDTGSLRFHLTTGTLHLLGPGEVTGAVPGSIIMTEGADTTFLVDGGTLSAGGANAVTAKTIEFKPGSTVDLTAATLTHTRPALTLSADTYTRFVSGTELGFKLNLPNQTLALDQSYELIVTKNDKKPFNGLEEYTHRTDVERRVKQVSKTTTGNDLILAGVADDNRVLTWTGAAQDGDWRTDGQINWTTKDDTNNDVGTFFQTGDAVVFGSAGAGTVNLSEAVTAAGMEVASGDYAFTGQSLKLVKNNVTGLLGDLNTGKLKISGGATVDFTDQESTAENSFVEGLELSGGGLKIASAKQLGLSDLGKLTWTGGTLTAAGTLSLTGALSATGVADKTLTVLQEGQNLTISDGLSAASAGKLIKNGAGTLTLGGGVASSLNLAVNAGTLALTGNQALSSFTLANGATLGGLDSARTITTTGDLTLAAGSKLAYDLTGIGTSSAALTLAASGGLTLTAADHTLNFKMSIINTPAMNTAYTLINAGGGRTVFDGVDLEADGLVDDSTIPDNMYAELSTDADGQYLYYTYRARTNNINPMIWQGTAADNIWKSGQDQPYLWKDNTTGLISHFLNADQVIFDGTDQAKTVQVAEDANGHGVVVSHMEITDGQYSFSGGYINGVINGSADGALAIKNSGTAASFTNDLSFAGGISVDSGAAMTFAGSSLKGNLTNNGTFNFDLSDEMEYTGEIAGANGAVINKTGEGVLTLAGDSARFVGQTTVTAGGLILDDVTLGGDVRVAGGATIGGTGTLGGNLTLTGATVESDLSGKGLEVVGTITANGSQILNLTDWESGTHTILIAGTDLGFTAADWLLQSNGQALGERQKGKVEVVGNLLQVDLGVANTVLTWNGSGRNWDGTAYNWTSDTKPSELFYNGDAVIFDSSADITEVQVDDTRRVASMTVKGGDYVFRGGVIEGQANPDLAGHDGQLLISGGSAAFEGRSSFTKATVASGGALALAGPTAEMKTGLTVESGGTYILGLGGTLDGDLTLKSGSILSIAGATTQTVTGTADLDSGLKAQLDYLTWTSGEETVLMTTGGQTGSFREQDFSAAAFSGKLTVKGNDLVLEVTETPGDNPGQAVGGSSNQQSAVNAVGSLPDNHPLKNILALPTKGEARRAADLVSGEGQDGTASALMGRQRGFGSSTGQRVAKKYQGNYRLAPASGEGETVSYLWAEIGAGESKIKGGGGMAEAKISGPQIALGLDGQTSDGWLGGVSLTYADLESKVGDRKYQADIDALGLNFWGGKDFRVGSGRLRALTGIGISRYELESKRTVTFSGFHDRLKADHTARGLDIFGEVSYNFEAGEWLNLEPFANLSYNRLHFKAYKEKGGPAALDYEAETQDGWSSVLGLRGLVQAGERVEIGLTLGWRHNFGDLDWSTGRAFRDGSDSFLVKGSGSDRNALETGLDLNLGLTERVGLTLSYDGLLGSNEQSHGGSARLSWEW